METLVRRHWDAAHRTAFLIVQDAAAAEDIAQEAMLAAVRAIDGFDRRRPFRPWLHRIVVNRSLDWVRARQRRPEVSGELAPAVAPVELVRVEGELRERLHASRPFGFWVTFVPRSARHAEFEIVSYGEDGGELGRYEYRSEVTN